VRVQRATERKVQLDSLRAFAILPVLYTHFWNVDNWMGTAGVFLFFMLSGYLITGILLRNRGKPSALRSFYCRRALRIAPIYYVALILSWPIDPRGMRESFPWHALYLSNVWFTLKNGWSPWFTAHLWTLSVEEQFYLVWPLLILMLPWKAIRPAIWCAILLGISFQFGGAKLLGINILGAGILTPAPLDKLGIGALLALAEAGLGFPRLLTNSGWAALVGVVAIEALPINRGSGWAPVLRTELLMLAFAALIAAASSGISGPVGVILNCRAVQYIGRISYGIYLFHLFVYGAVAAILGLIGHRPLEHGPSTFVILSALSIGVAALSWHFFERPLNRLRERVGENQIALNPSVAP
jgi:peptidoglycan/LPS O-acetylase OafA/YrhL